MKKKLFALILAGVMAFSLAGCKGEAEQTEEPKETTKLTEPEESQASETYSKDFGDGIQSVTVQDLTYSVPTAWEASAGKNGFTY